jgi:hypothetical protein
MSLVQAAVQALEGGVVSALISTLAFDVPLLDKL